MPPNLRLALDRGREAILRARSLGLGAPVRAAYELSKHAGGHRAVFMTLARRSGRRTAWVAPPPDQPRREYPAGADARSRAISAADTVSTEGTLVFGTRRKVLPDPSWHALVERPGNWPETAWWRIDIRSNRRLGDVKWTWEVGRQAHVVLLARAVASAPDRNDLRGALEEQLATFIRQNPAEIGIHWYSNLELAIRTLRWIEVLSLVSLPADLVRGMRRQIQHTQSHMTADLPYTISTMRNNHLLGDGLGLQGCSQVTGARWAGRLGSWLFDWQLAHHVSGTGRMIEDSVSYHRFVTEMLMWRLMLPGARPFHRDAVVRAAQALARLGALAGPVPQYGDWDEGRMLVTAQDPSRLEGSVCLALALGGTGAPEEWRNDYDECAWYSAPGVPVAPESPVAEGADVGLGIARASAGDFVTWLKAGAGPSHGHADLCSTSILADGHWVVGDPGTGTYNGPRKVRDYFRSSAAHSVVRVEGVDQLEPVGAFGWRHSAFGAVGSPIAVPGGSLAWGGHTAYCRLKPGRRVVRTVMTVPEAVVVADWVEGGEFNWDLALPLGPEVTLCTENRNPDAVTVRVADTRYRLHLPCRATARHGEEDPFAGWWSSTYGTWSPAWILQMGGRQASPLMWAIVVPGGRRPTVEGDTVSWGDLVWGVSWTTEHATVWMTGAVTARCSLPMRAAHGRAVAAGLGSHRLSSAPST